MLVKDSPRPIRAVTSPTRPDHRLETLIEAHLIPTGQEEKALMNSAIEIIQSAMNPYAVIISKLNHIEAVQSRLVVVKPRAEDTRKPRGILMISRKTNTMTERMN